MTNSLYIHIPFCISHCDYCDFYSELAPKARNDEGDLLDTYVEKLQGELNFVINFYNISKVPTLYIGGGTPSVLGRKRLEIILGHLSPLLKAWPREVTVEANPESVTRDMLAMLRDRGVNRLSLGIQSLDETCRRAVNRSGTVDQCRKALDLAEVFFPQAFTADLMAGLPYQSARGLCDDIQEVLSAGAVHVSLYSLILEESTALAHQVRWGTNVLPPEEEAEEIWLAGRNALIGKGLQPYEVSNFAIPGYESHHNMRYWHMKGWVGCGPGASSTLIDESSGTGQRYTNRADLSAYLAWNGKELPPGEFEILDRKTLLRESLMMGFRTIYGPDEMLFTGRFHQSIAALIPETLNLWKQRGFLQENRLALTAEGLLLLNSFLVDCFKELDRQGL